MRKHRWLLLIGLVGNLATGYTALTLAGPWWLRFTHLGVFLVLFNASLIFWSQHTHELRHGRIRPGVELGGIVLLDLLYSFIDISSATHGWPAYLWQVANVVNYMTLPLAIMMIGYRLSARWHKHLRAN